MAERERAAAGQKASGSCVHPSSIHIAHPAGASISPNAHQRHIQAALLHFIIRTPLVNHAAEQ